jgi:hypothetical protein
MQCNQLIRLIKDWFLHVKEETMAPARMMQFIDQHIKECDLCREDPDLQQEIEKIREFILPDSKIPKAYRAHAEAPTPEISPAVPAEPAPAPAKDAAAVTDEPKTSS